MLSLAGEDVCGWKAEQIEKRIKDPRALEEEGNGEGVRKNAGPDLSDV